MKPVEDKKAEFNAAYMAYQNKDFGMCFEMLDDLLKSPGLSKEVRANAHFLYGHTCYAVAEKVEAIHHFEKCLKIIPNHNTYIELGRINRELGLYKKSIYYYNQAIQIEPDNINDYMGIASTYRKLYDDESAVKAYRKILKIDPDFCKAYRNMSLCLTYDSTDHPDRFKLEERLQSKDLDEEDMSQCYYALAKIYNDCDDYDQAFKYYELGNKTRGKTRPFDAKTHSTKIFNQMNVFTKAFFDQYNEFQSDTEKPVFIIGISRAGKTLVERLINQHNAVADKEELASLNKLINYAIDIEDPYHYEQNILNTFNSDTNKEMIETYLEDLEFNTDKTIQRITDTTPCNYRYIGFIHMLFPKAKFIFCQRNPLDHCLQVFFKYYKKGHRFTYDLKTLGEYYTHHLEIMDHWRRNLPKDAFMDVRYEEVIKDPIKWQKDILSFIGLDINDSISNNLEFSQKEAERWKHFEKHLKPLKKILKGYLDE